MSDRVVVDDIDELMKVVLIVDDSPTMRRMVRASLSQISGISFVEAGTGLEAIEQLTLTPANLMILDLNMPDMHGMEVLQFVRKHQKFSGIPIIVLTTKSDDSSKIVAMEAGASHYMTKPFLPNVLALLARDLLNL
jgi:two-component system chemotaxis response regulator CheY